MIVPLFRLYSAGQGDHFYTISEQERDNAVERYGYTYEGIACYVHDSPADPEEELWERLYLALLTSALHLQFPINAPSPNVVKIATEMADALTAQIMARRNSR